MRRSATPEKCVVRMEGNVMSYAEEYHADDLFVIDAALEERLTFIRRTYLHVFAAVLGFIGLEAAFLNTPAITTPLVELIGENWWIALVAFMIVSWVAGKWARSGTSQGTQYLGLAIYIVAEAIIFVPLLWMVQRFGGEHVIPIAAFLTFMIFSGLTAVVFMTRKDFSFLRNILWLGNFVALAVVVVSLFVDMGSVWTYVVLAMIVLMCGFILYDTSNILHHYRTDQHVAAALALFASVTTLFWYVVQLVYLSDD